MIILDLQLFYQNTPKARPILAIDYGQKKLGIAISDLNWTLAMPIATEKIIANNHISIVLAYIQKYNPAAIVIGLPVNMNASFSPQTEIVQKFAAKLEGNIPLELNIFLQDERLTSKGADSLLKMGGLNRKERNAIDDGVAASLILDSVLKRFRTL